MNRCDIFLPRFKFYLFIGLISHTYYTIPAELNTSFSQEKIIRKILRSDELRKSKNPFKKSGLISSVLSNYLKLTSTKLHKLGFKEYYIETQEGYCTKIFAKLTDAKKPTLAFIAGLGASATMSSFSNFALPIAERMNWNILLIENSSHANWTKRNNYLHISGYEAGWNLYLLLKSLKKHDQISPYISGVHLIGLSLGGSDSAFASYFDSVIEKKPLIKSIMAWSSPAERYLSLAHLRQKKGIVQTIVRSWMQDIYMGSRSIIERFTPKTFKWFFQKGHMDDVITTVFIKSSEMYFARNPQHFKKIKGSFSLIPIEHYSHIRDLKKYYRLMSLDSYLRHMKRPILWLHAIDDPIVDYYLNSNYLRSKNLPEHIGLLITTEGGHLGQPQAFSKLWVLKSIISYVKYWELKNPL